MPLTIGQPVPDFTLKTHKMEELSLQSLRGRNVLLLFIPLAFTAT